ncbi:MFS transporter [Metaclostridioides mangenotii]|uniref:MFS transporter n=1 Tax=Metaclostridioides mangenotii TaxID=1540 RepID=UPI00046372B2|nr:MFS transporter [Clostridioides mangenotii]
MDNGWKNRATKFLIAQTISLFGSSIVQYAIIYYITLTTSSGLMMSIASICGYIPQIGISLFAGVWIDRYDRKKLMIISDGVISLATLSIAVLFLMGYKSIWYLFVVLVVRSAGTGIQTPAVNAFIPQIVPKDLLIKVNGINTTLTSLMVFLSPAISGAILSIASIEVTFFIDVITAIIGIGIMFTIKAPRYIFKKSDENINSTIGEIKAGILYIKENKFVKQQIIYLMVVAVLISPSAFLTPLLVSRSFGAGVWRLSVSQMIFSLGAVSGGILVSTWGGFKIRRSTIIFATILYGTMMVGMGLAPIYQVFLIFNFLIGISMPCYNTPINVSLQENVEPNMYGRVFSMVQIASACALPLGIIIFGPMADVVSIQILLVIMGLFVVCYALYSFRCKDFTKI